MNRALRLYLRPAAPSRHRDVRPILATPLHATLTQPPANVASKALTKTIKLFRCNTYEKPGGGKCTSNIGSPKALCAKGTRPQRFHVRRIYIHRYRSLDQLNRNHDPEVSLPPQQDSYGSCQRPAAHPYFLPGGQIRMRLRAKTPRKPRLQDFHFCIRQRRRQSA